MKFIHYENPFSESSTIFSDMEFDTETLLFDGFGKEYDLMEINPPDMSKNYILQVCIEYFLIFLSIPFSKRVYLNKYNTCDQAYINFTIKDYKNFLRSLDYDKALQFFRVMSYIYNKSDFLYYYPTVIYMYKLTYRYFNMKFNKLSNIVNMEIKLCK